MSAMCLDIVIAAKDNRMKILVFVLKELSQMVLNKDIYNLLCFVTLAGTIMVLYRPRKGTLEDL